MKVIGIDASLRATGFCALNSDGGYELQVWKPPQKKGAPKLEEAPRLSWFREQTRQCLAEHAPDLLALEGYAFGASASRAHALGELGGVIRLVCFDFKQPILIVPPTVLKKYVCDKGNAPKAIMMREAFRRWEITHNDDNAVDAYCLAKFAVEYRTNKTKAFQVMRTKVQLFEWGE